MRLRFITVSDFQRFWLRFKYPKFTLLIFTFVLAYVLIAGNDLAVIRDYFAKLGYVGAFVAGIFYAYGFTAAPATGIFLVIAKEPTINLWVAGIIAGSGALLADLLIFKFIRSSFSDEIAHLANEPLTLYIHGKIPAVIKKYLVPAVGCVIIASPLPDELGVTMVAVSTMSARLFMIFSYLLNTAGIIIVLLIGSAL